ncbi:uncharacterized protein LOC131858630 [Cryptomeria japonica]|uniref:uncharacterized protein LOC131858630 n=1 Tax=Cryptomeria japonica TaxID=3369 RepID=UPI0027D9EFDF|nr:uncharacterized protein LOC131858630 [Cryptomeria japonica]
MFISDKVPEQPVVATAYPRKEFIPCKPREAKISVPLVLDVVEQLNKASTNVSLWDLLNILEQKNRLKEALVEVERPADRNVANSLQANEERFATPATQSRLSAMLTNEVTPPNPKWKGIYLKTSSNYYPQGNGLAESTNKNLIRLIKRMGSEHKREWHHHLRSALWVDWITPKKILKNSPYKLVYDKDALFPVSLEIPSLQLLKSIEVAKNEPMEVRLAELMELEEAREAVFESLQNRQQIIKRWFDNKKSSDPELKLSDLVLKYKERAAKPGQRTKFDGLWEGPFRITNCKGFNAFDLENMQGESLEISVNGFHLKP